MRKIEKCKKNKNKTMNKTNANPPKNGTKRETGTKTHFEVQVVAYY